MMGTSDKIMRKGIDKVTDDLVHTDETSKTLIGENRSDISRDARIWFHPYLKT